MKISNGWLKSSRNKFTLDFSKAKLRREHSTDAMQVTQPTSAQRQAGRLTYGLVLNVTVSPDG